MVNIFFVGGLGTVCGAVGQGLKPATHKALTVAMAVAGTACRGMPCPYGVE